MGNSGELDKSSYMNFYKWNQICYLLRLCKSIEGYWLNSKSMKQIQE